MRFFAVDVNVKTNKVASGRPFFIGLSANARVNLHRSLPSRGTISLWQFSQTIKIFRSRKA